jgi:branched-chain amino acid aminotransferase
MPIITAATIRNHPNAMPPRIKSLNYLNNILAKIEARDAGVSEAVMLNHQGYVAECTGENIFIVREGVLFTPPISAGILIGITQRFVMRLARKMRIAIREVDLTRHDLYTADECFLTGTAAEIVPVNSVDKRIVGTGKPGPITRKLMAAFHKATGR